MGVMSVEKFQHLFWLGRYTERVFSTLRIFCKYYDKMIDNDIEKIVYKDFCNKLGIPDVYGSKEVFLNNYLFDKSNPNSVGSSMVRAFDNAVVMRKEISTETLSYIQLALDELEKCKESSSPIVRLQKVMDYIFAFWGSVDDNVLEENFRNVMKTARYIERVDLYCRMGYSQPEIEKEFSKLKNRIGKTGVPYDEPLLQKLGDIVKDEEKLKFNYFTIIGSLSNLVKM